MSQTRKAKAKTLPSQLNDLAQGTSGINDQKRHPVPRAKSEAINLAQGSRNLRTQACSETKGLTQKKE